MPEKPPEVRHAEHEAILKRIDGIDAAVAKIDDDADNFRVRQADTFAEFRVELLKEVRTIERSIASKCEQDSAIIATQNRELMRSDRVESAGTATAQALAVVTENMRTLKTSTDLSLDAAHKAIRKLEPRIDKLEHMGGRWAIRVLGIAGSAAVGAFVLWVLQKLGIGRA